MKKSVYLSILSVLLMAFITIPAFAGGKVKAGTSEWPPYYGTGLKNGGFVSELTREAFKRTGWEFEVKFMNWNRAMGLLKQGKIDMIQGGYYTEERAKEFHISKEFASADIVFFKKKGSTITYATLEDLKGRTIGIIRGWAYPDAFTQADYLKKEVTDEPKTNIMKLVKGRVDLIIGAKMVVLDIANAKLPGQADQLVALDPPIQKNNLHNIFTRAHGNGGQMAKDFNKGLEMIIADGTYDAILKKHGF